MARASSARDNVEGLRARVETLEQEKRHLLAVVEILQEIAGSLHVADIVQAVARRLGETFGLDRCSIFLAERGGETVRLVASYEDPAIRNYVVDVGRYPELRRALETGETVFIPDVETDPSLRHARDSLVSRRVKNITVVPITWRGVPIGAIFLRTFRDGPPLKEADIQFCQVVASLTAKALRNAHRFERIQSRRGEDPAGRAVERERAALLGFLRRLLNAFAAKEGPLTEEVLGRATAQELDRLVGVAVTALSQEASAR